MIITARQHFDHFDEMPPDLSADLMTDVQTAARVLRRLPDVTRVNVAILGNQHRHVHVDVIPRRDTESNRGLAPWDHAPVHRPLTTPGLDHLTERLRRDLSQLQPADGVQQ